MAFAGHRRKLAKSVFTYHHSGLLGSERICFGSLSHVTA
ncbi:hypothetical protein CEXT_462241, partial [Caerostris extrusa]